LSALHRDEHGTDRHQGLARTDVALQQPVHRVRPRQVVLDLGDGTTLRAGELVRHGRAQSPGEAAVERVTNAECRTFQRPLAHHQDGLHAQQLVERQPAARHLLLPHRFRQVDLAERVVTADETETTAHGGGNRIGDAPCLTAVQRVFHPAGDLPRVERRLLALRVDGHDATGAVTNEIDDRIRHLQSAAVDVGLAEQGDLQPGLELTFTPRLVEEHDVQPTAAIPDHGLDHGLAVPHHALRCRADGDEHQRFLAGYEIVHSCLVGAVDPTTRVGGEEIQHRVDSDLVQRCELAFADTLQSLDVDVGEVAQGERISGHSTPNRYGYSGWPPRCTSTWTLGWDSANHACMASV
jgi:hypothetical protein